MDKVADVILALQQKGIAAIWRPFHEAAGNATAKSYTGKAWFWWGADGADVFKQLWVALYNRLRERGVHNLIYVWTSQNNNGNSSSYDNDGNWYPGDGYVDIIARDLYGFNAAQNEQEFRELTARYPHKMITVAECGNNSSTGASFADVADFWNAGARWSWFMPWYGSSMPSDQWWSDAFSQPFVITRDQVRLDATYVEESASNAVKNMRLAWNLGNSLDAFSTSIGNNKEPEKYETCWGQPVTKPELMTFLKKEGFNAIRVPVTWWQHLDSNDNIDEAWMKRVQEVVDYVISQGMYCIINVHHDTGNGDAVQHWLKADIDKFDQMNTRFQKLWQQISTRFISYDQRLLFEGYNEMLDKDNTWTNAKESSSYTAVNQFAQSFVNTVRATGGNNATRNLIVTPYSAAIWDGLANFTIPTDNVSGHLLAEIHSYDPYNWLSSAGTWGTTQSNFIRDMYTRLNNTFVSKGIPVIIGECGIIGENDVDINAIKAKKQEAAKHIADVISQGKTLNIPVFYWMTLIDGTDRSVPQWTIPEIVEAMKAAYYE
jgi:aryl-phospho-beta-D-glucosidase BglC (GH1 family)